MIFASLALLVLFFSVKSVMYFWWGMRLYDDLPDNEVYKVPESYLLYSIYLGCLSVNLICIVVMTYILCYVGIVTW